jgi:GH25 family lysozyme M1 (1,4-beta-N-acetylmuramidase)
LVALGCSIVGLGVVAALLAAHLPGARADASLPAGTPPGCLVAGIDVSAYNGVVDWRAVKADGASFAYARASEQANTPDTNFPSNYAGAKAQGLYVGAYHRARPDASSGKAQADYFLDRAQFSNDGKALPPVLDLEWPRSGWTGPRGERLDSCYNMRPAEIVAWTRAFLAEVATRTGRLGAVYTSASWWNLCTDSDTTFGQSPLWVARYSASPLPLPAGWTGFTFWRYSSAGRLPSGQVIDRDVFSGDPAALASLAQGTPTALTNWVDARYQHVAYLSGDGRVNELYARLPDGRWAMNDLTALARAPAALPGSGLSSWVDAKYQHVAYLSADGHVHELYYRLPDGRWTEHDLTTAARAPTALPGAAISTWLDAKYQHVAYLSPDGHVHELYFRLSGGRWTDHDLSIASRAPTALLGTALSSRVDGAYQHVSYMSADGHIHELSLRLPAGRWAERDLTTAARAPAALLGTALSSWVDGAHQHVSYVSADGHVHELYARRSGGRWTENDLTRAARAAPALLGTAITSWSRATSQQLAYLSADGHIRVLYFGFEVRGWRASDLTTTAGASRALLSTTLSSCADAAYQHVRYFAVDGHAHEVYFRVAGTRASERDLHMSAVGTG